MERFYVILDNGHGVDTEGKRSPMWSDGTQLLEYKYAREIVDGIISQFPCREDIELIKLVPEEEDISLRERCSRANVYANRYGKKNILGVSVHVNAFNGKATGWEVHTYKGKSVSDMYAEIFWRTIQENDFICMRADMSDGDHDWDSNFAILRDTSAPFILTENGFMDNEKECRFLLSEEGRQRIIQNHIWSILRSHSYWKENKDKEGFLSGNYSIDNVLEKPL